mgnify:CR=1 FL=1
MNMAQTILILTMTFLSIITLYFVCSMVESEKAKAKAYEEFKAIRDAEHAEWMNTYYRERDESRAKFEKELADSWVELANSLKELMSAKE